MRWRDWLGCSLLAGSVGVSGCVSAGAVLKPIVHASPDNNEAHDGITVARALQADVETIGPKSATTLGDAPPQDVGSLIINGIPAARIRASVNTEAITDEEVKAACYPMLRRLEMLPEPERSQRQLQVFKETLDQIVEREVVLQVAIARLKKNAGEAQVKKLLEIADKQFDSQWIQPLMKSNNIKSETEFQTALKEMNVSLSMMKRQWTRNWMAQEFVRQMVVTKVDKVGHLQMEDYYRRHPEDFQIADSVEWEDVFVSETLHPPRAVARQRAEEVLARMRRAEPIAQLLADHLDDGDSSLRDGRGLGRKHGEIKPVEAEGPLFQLKDGEAALVEIGSGFHVVRVVKREYAGMRPFDDREVQKLIKDKLRNEIGQREMKQLVSELRKQAVVEYLTGAN
jgi:peptidyl-prolyl cis-trans isomerase SurA